MTTQKTFTCEACSQTFISARSDEEAVQEYEVRFGKDMGEDMGVLCEDCGVEFDKWFAKNSSRFGQ